MLASLRVAQGDPKGAIPLLRQALALKEKAFKPNHPQIANTLVNLAVTLPQAASTGGELTDSGLLQLESPRTPTLNPAQSDDPEPLLRRALLIYESAFGAEHRAVFSASFHLATCLHKKGRFSEAEPLYRRALAISEKVWGPEHSETASTMGMLAKLLHATGDLTGARLLMGRAYNIAAKTLGEKHPTTLDMKSTLNGLMMKLAPPPVN
jgi:tetratricopeptide (TPR) repeat protein